MANGAHKLAPVYGMCVCVVVVVVVVVDLYRFPKAYRGDAEDAVHDDDAAVYHRPTGQYRASCGVSRPRLFLRKGLQNGQVRRAKIDLRSLTSIWGSILFRPRPRRASSATLTRGSSPPSARWVSHLGHVLPCSTAPRPPPSGLRRVHVRARVRFGGLVLGGKGARKRHIVVRARRPFY